MRTRRVRNQTNATRVRSWHAAVGLCERYRYAPGPAGRDAVHAHAEVQLCLSLDFHGRYRWEHRLVHVPARAVSLVDAWEPHAAEDPTDRPSVSHYDVLYVSQTDWDAAAADVGRTPRVGILVRDEEAVVRACAALVASSRIGSRLEQEERLRALAATLLSSIDARGREARVDDRRLSRARDFLHAHALEPISLASVAAIAGLSAQHLAASFRARYGVPPHRFQTLMRLDRARVLLSRGTPISDVATWCGFSDQSHLTRHFRRYLQLTPGSYRAETRSEPEPHDT